MDQAHVTWTGGRRLISTDAAGHSIVMDVPVEYGGKGEGVRPLELVLHALAGCTAMDIVSVLEKKRQDLRGLEIIVTATQREDEYPKIYTDIGLEYVVSGFGIGEDAVARAIELSEQKYCSVKGMLGPQVVVTTSYRVVEERPAGMSAVSAASMGSE